VCVNGAAIQERDTRNYKTRQQKPSTTSSKKLKKKRKETRNCYKRGKKYMLGVVKGGRRDSVPSDMP